MPTTHRFGAFELDLPNAELRRNGIPVKLSPQPFDALVLLVERAGTLVTREEMQAALWGDDRHVDFNAGLNFCMGQLRTALGDDAKSLIQTVPRRGYRFTGTLAAPAVAAVETPSARGSSIKWAAAAVLVVAGGAAAAVRFSAAPMPPAGSSSLTAVAHREHAVVGLADTGPGDLRARIDELHLAVEADPNFARAYADLAEAHLMQAQYRADAPQSAYARAKAAAMRALELDPSLGEAHAAYAASVLHLEWNWKEAGDHFSRAMRASGENPRTLYWYSRYLAASGRADDAVRAAEKAVKADPGGIRTRANLGFVSLYARRYDTALASCEQALTMLPKFSPARSCAAVAALGLNDTGRAVAHASAELEDARDVEWLKGAVAKEGAAGYWRSEYRQAEMQGCDAHAMWAAISLARLGDNDRALGWLERAVELHADTLIYAGVQPAFDHLRGTPRFDAVLRRVSAR